MAQSFVGPISGGTLKADRVLPEVLSLLERIAPAAAAKFREENREVVEAGFDRHKLTEDLNRVDWAWENLFDLVNDNLPEGYYFGTAEGDGACFGVWEVE